MKLYTSVDQVLGFSRRYSNFTILQVLEKEPDFIDFCIRSVKGFRLTKGVSYAHTSYRLKQTKGIPPVVTNTSDAITLAVRSIADRNSLPVESVSLTGRYCTITLTTGSAPIKFLRKSQWWYTELQDLILRKYERSITSQDTNS